MKTKDVPAVVMLLAGGVYCVMGISHQTPLWEFTLYLLPVLIIFWMIGGILRMILDKYMVEMADKPEEEQGEVSEDAEAQEQTETAEETSSDEDE